MPRMAGRAQLRRHAMKLRYWRAGELFACDLSCVAVPGEQFYELRVDEGFGLTDGFRIVFCDGPNPVPDGTICVLAVLRGNEPLTPTMLAILRGREQVARERSVGGTAPANARPEDDDDSDPPIR